MRKAVIIIVIVLVVIILVFLRIQCSMRSRIRDVEKAPLPIEVMAASKGDVVNTCEVLGSVTARKTAQVFPETMGRITRILVKEGSTVYKNSRLMGLRNETIGFEYEEGFITSPISGSVAKLMVDVGSMVTPQMSVAEVVDYSTVKVEFRVGETNIGCIEKKNSVLVTVDGLPGEEFHAKISEISPVVDPGTRTVSIKAMVNNPKRLLKPGMTARVTVNLGAVTDVVVVPKEAFREGFVFVVSDSIAEKRAVEAGIMGDISIQIVNGLEVGEWVVVIGQERLAGGEKVNPIEALKEKDE
jgi:multidrug efflux pump subunit AcrA (membrane-fusion protein)